jgi:hypothetical protein
VQTREIEYEQWQPFFNDFTQLHQGERVNVETMGGDFAPTSQWCGVPLLGIVSIHPKAGDDERIEVIARGSPPAAAGAQAGAGADAGAGAETARAAEDHATHSIARPAKVHLAEDENGRAVALQIESQDRSITMIRFEPPHENLPQGFRIA